MTKVCTQCGIEKDLDSFYKDKGKKDGRQYACKLCKNKKDKVYYDENSDCIKNKVKNYQTSNRGKELRVKINKKYNSSSKGKVAMRKGIDKFKNNHPEMVKAHSAVQYAIRTGKLTRLPCKICNDPKSEAHHFLGYEKEHWLDVEFLCKKHHIEADRTLQC